jgi:hypothetical protein
LREFIMQVPKGHVTECRGCNVTDQVRYLGNMVAPVVVRQIVRIARKASQDPATMLFPLDHTADVGQTFWRMHVDAHDGRVEIVDGIRQL